MSVLDKIIEVDHKLFIKINGEWHNSFFDTFLTFSREPQLWIPFYFFLIMFTTINFKKNGWYWVLFLALSVMVSDYISSTFIKYEVQRLRPCQDPSMLANLRLLVNGCPGNPSFTSSHAVNHFCVSMFVYTTYVKQVSKWWGLIFLWALTISYAQVYVGVHYPLDVICGSIIGCILGYFPARIYNNRLGLKYPEMIKQ